MPLYIVRSKAGPPARGLSLAGRKLTADARKGQLQEVIAVNTSDPIHRSIRQWLRRNGEAQDAPPRRPLSRPADRAKPSRPSRSNETARDVSPDSVRDILGLHLLDMSSEEASRLAADINDIEVIPDRPIELIRPTKASGESVRPSDKTPRNQDWDWFGSNQSLQGLEQRTGAGVTVAVLDTGVDGTHPELADRIAAAYTFDFPGQSVIPQTPSTDTDSHGTHVAGLICGRTVGIAPGAAVVSGVMIPGGYGTVSNIAVALGWVAERLYDVRVINLSAGVPGYAPELRDAVQAVTAVGILTAAAIGNEGPNQTRSPGNFASVLSVGSFGFDEHGRLRASSFSGSGYMNVDHHQYAVPSVLAHGENARSCVPGGGYDSFSGTSMATGRVTGLAALLIEEDPFVDLLELKARIGRRLCPGGLGAIGVSMHPGDLESLAFHLRRIGW